MRRIVRERLEASKRPARRTKRIRSQIRDRLRSNTPPQEDALPDQPELERAELDRDLWQVYEEDLRPRGIKLTREADMEQFW